MRYKPFYRSDPARRVADAHALVGETVRVVHRPSRQRDPDVERSYRGVVLSVAMQPGGGGQDVLVLRRGVPGASVDPPPLDLAIPLSQVYSVAVLAPGEDL